MLTCYEHTVRLRQNNLAYAGFRLGVLETLCQMDMCRGLDEQEEPFGYLVEVPFLEQVAPAVQVDLLADVWRRHQDPGPHDASLLDAAVVYAAFCTAGRILNDEPQLARSWLQAGPRRVRCQLSAKTPARLHELFFAFWDDVDFLSVDALQDLHPRHARRVKELMCLAEDQIGQMEEVLTRWRASPAVMANLTGLLTEAEIQGFCPLLTRSPGTD